MGAPRWVQGTVWETPDPISGAGTRKRAGKRAAPFRRGHHPWAGLLAPRRRRRPPTGPSLADRGTSTTPIPCRETPVRRIVHPGNTTGDVILDMYDAHYARRGASKQGPRPRGCAQHCRRVVHGNAHGSTKMGAEHSVGNPRSHFWGRNKGERGGNERPLFAAAPTQRARVRVRAGLPLKVPRAAMGPPEIPPWRGRRRVQTPSQDRSTSAVGISTTQKARWGHHTAYACRAPREQTRDRRDVRVRRCRCLAHGNDHHGTGRGITYTGGTGRVRVTAAARPLPTCQRLS